MQRLTRNGANQLRRKIVQRSSSELGDYFEPKLYSEDEVFSATSAPGQLRTDSTGNAITDPYNNPLSVTPYAFTLNNVSPNGVGNGSVIILSQNIRRQFLIIQNLSTGADLFVNFGTDAGPNRGLKLGAGEGVFFDQGDKGCPNNSVYVFFNTATLEPGIIMEGAPTF